MHNAHTTFTVPNWLPEWLGGGVVYEPKADAYQYVNSLFVLIFIPLFNVLFRAIDPARVIVFTTRAGYGPGVQNADLSGFVSLAGSPVGNCAFDLHDYFGARWGDGINENPTNPACEVSCSIKQVLGAVFKRAETSMHAPLRETSVADLLRRVGATR
jgi:hypothetical protein